MDGNGLESIFPFPKRFNFSALSPTPPFPRFWPRIRLALLLVPALFTSLFVTGSMFFKGSTFITGFVFFGQPVMDKGIEWLNSEFPNWQKLLEIRKYPSPAISV